MEHVIQLNSLEATHDLAKQLARDVHGGSIFALSGPVGAGKTTFVKALAAALDITETIVSPTYTLLQPYSLPHPVGGATQLIHIDAYRIEHADELRAVGVEDFLNDPTCVVVIEWAERVEELLRERAVVLLKFSLDDTGRRCTVE